MSNLGHRTVTAILPHATVRLLEAYALRNGLSRANAILRFIEQGLASEGSKIAKTTTYNDECAHNKAGIPRHYVLRELL
jgi:hypothetical protein